MNHFRNCRESILADGSLGVPYLPEQPNEKLATTPGTPSPFFAGDLAQWAKILPPAVEPARSPDESFRKEFLPSHPPEQVGHFASPLSPLRERDLAALATWFHREDMYAIESDLNQMLLHLLPEPCWDEDAFDFLQEFL